MITYSIIVTVAFLIAIAGWRDSHNLVKKIRATRDEYKEDLYHVRDARDKNSLHLSWTTSLVYSLVKARTFESKRKAILAVAYEPQASDLLKLLNQTYTWKADRLLSRRNSTTV